MTTSTPSNTAVSDQAGTYTATIKANQIATNIKAGTITLDGTNTVLSNKLATTNYHDAASNHPGRLNPLTKTI